jgi:NADPH:quinone reductase-like Zn-dependent oxidoreductase
MRAIVQTRYGAPNEVLELQEVDQPAPNADELLLMRLAASVNAADWHVLRGKPLFSRATLAGCFSPTTDPRRRHRRAGGGGRQRRDPIQARR